MVLHFVCTGNSYRSRLAQAYLNSKQIKGLEVISSGIAAFKNTNGPICWYSQRIIENNKLVPFESFHWQQTTKELLDKSDLIIFMKYLHFEYCEKELGYKGKNHKVFDIDDLAYARSKFFIKPKKNSWLDNILCIGATEKTFSAIKKKIDDLIPQLSAGA